MLSMRVVLEFGELPLFVLHCSLECLNLLCSTLAKIVNLLVHLSLIRPHGVCQSIRFGLHITPFLIKEFPVLGHLVLHLGIRRR